ncbi:MAG: DegT/DnrJ/EryC1/StrS family aminotransferase [Anaerolineales bacterium]
MSNPTVPFVDLRAQHEEVRPQIEAAIADVINRSSFIGGSYVSAFEREFAGYLGVKEVVGCANGTDSLWLAFTVAGVKPGDAVITVPNTFIATTEAITRCGALPLFVDCSLATASMDMSALKTFLAKHCVRGDDGSVIHLRSKHRVAAILPVHLYGLPVDIETLMQIAREYALPVVEDACQAHGAGYRFNGEWQRAGTVGVAAGFSFYPGKNLGAMGDAGAFATNDPALADQVRYLRDHGSKDKYVHITPAGWNSRLDSLQAAVLSIKLKKLDEWNARRRQAAAWYREALAGLPLDLPDEPEYARPIYHLYVVRSSDRDRLQKELGARGIGVGLHYPIPLHLQAAYTSLGHSQGDFPNAERSAATGLSLPMHPTLSLAQVHQVADACREILGAS